MDSKQEKFDAAREAYLDARDAYTVAREALNHDTYPSAALLDRFFDARRAFIALGGREE